MLQGMRMLWGCGCSRDRDALGTGMLWGCGCSGDRDAVGMRMLWGQGCSEGRDAVGLGDQLLPCLGGTCLRGSPEDHAEIYIDRCTFWGLKIPLVRCSYPVRHHHVCIFLAVQ